MLAVRQSARVAGVTIRLVAAEEFQALVADLVDLMIDTVNAGGSIGFLAPVVPEEVRAYWESLAPDVRSGRRLFVGAFVDGRVIGSGQLALAPWPNARHRAELQKLFVGPAMRERGVARSLMSGLHAAARQHGRSLILLNARRGSIAERFYRSLGYCEIGIVPGYAVGPDGQLRDSVSLYRQLDG